MRIISDATIWVKAKSYSRDITYDRYLRSSVTIVIYDCNMFMVQAPGFIQLANVCAIFPRALAMLTLGLCGL